MPLAVTAVKKQTETVTTLLRWRYIQHCAALVHSTAAEVTVQDYYYVYRTYLKGVHKNLPGTYLTVFTDNIWSY